MRELQNFQIDGYSVPAFDRGQAATVFNSMTPAERERFLPRAGSERDPRKTAPQLDSAAAVFARRRQIIEAAGHPRTAASTEGARAEDRAWSPDEIYRFRASIFERAGRSRMPAGHFSGDER